MAKKESWVRITFDAPVSGKITTKERNARKRLEAAIETAMEQYHRQGESISSIEMYPTD